jgi:hypothetical protein
MSPPTYQLDFVTPGRTPWCAIVLKHILQIPNFLKNPLGLPQIAHLLCFLTANFGCFFDFNTMHFFAIFSPLITF